MKFHLHHSEDALPPQGELEEKLMFLGERADKARSVIGERVAQSHHNMICGRVAAVGIRAFTDVHVRETSALMSIDSKRKLIKLNQDSVTS